MELYLFWGISLNSLKKMAKQKASKKNYQNYRKSKYSHYSRNETVATREVIERFFDSL